MYNILTHSWLKSHYRTWKMVQWINCMLFKYNELILDSTVHVKPNVVTHMDNFNVPSAK